MLLIKRYSENTVNTYVSLLQNFQKHIGFEKAVESLSDREIYNEVVKLVEKKKYSYSSQKQLLSTIKLYLSEIHKRDIDLEPVYPVRKPQKLPVILSVLEVKKILLSVTNVKHKAMLATVYALGLRSGELINLRLDDIHKDQQIIHTKASKGNKDSRGLKYRHHL